MKKKLLAILTIVVATLVCSFTLFLTTQAEQYPVINTENANVEMLNCRTDDNGIWYMCDRFGNLTDIALDGVYENHRYELQYYRKGVAYTGIAIVDGEEWQFENGTAKCGEYWKDGNRTVYIDGKPVTGPYTYFNDEFIVPGHVDSFTTKSGFVYEAYRWMYAENGKYHDVDGWHGSEDYKRYYINGMLFSGVVSDLNWKGTPEYGKAFEKGLLFTGFENIDTEIVLCYQNGEMFYGHYQVTGEELWRHTTKKEIIEYWNLEAGKTYLFVKAENNSLNHTTLQEGFYEEENCLYWYEKGLRQGMQGRGKEIYDPETDAWYWLDAVDNGKVAVSKDVYQESYAGSYADREDGTGKWVRYDSKGHMIKGWSDTEAGTYYFDPETGAMVKGTVIIDGMEYTFDRNTGILLDENQHHCVWVSVDGKDYWYENGVRQGYVPENVFYRGKEIFDPATNEWYWLDNIQQGAKAVSKDVYQESYAGSFADREDGTGKWVRYDENGHMVKGWNKVVVEGQIQNHYKNVWYYFDLETGAMVKGKVSIIEMFDGTLQEFIYLFDEADGHRIEMISHEPYTGDRLEGSAVRI